MSTVDSLSSSKFDSVYKIYQNIFKPHQHWLGIIIILTFVDLVILITSTPHWLESIEIVLSFALGAAVIWLGYQIFEQVFEIYVLNAAIENKRKVNSELLILAKLAANGGVILLVVFLFAQTHKINIFGLLASLGVGGLAIAFAAQKTLEQILGGIVLYVDSPFVTDDYIGLPDGTFGRVESIGLRSTKIRTSGKGTLMVVPNSVLTETNIENFTGAKKVISLIYLTFHQIIPQEERAFIRQLILDSTSDIFGIDSRSTEVIFKDITNQEKAEITQAQISFFILGSGDVSMDLRHQLLDIAKQNINKQLQEYGVVFDLEEKTINVNAPITV